MNNSGNPPNKAKVSTLQEVKAALRESEKALEKALRNEREAISLTEERIAVTAHDFRASLAPMIGYSEIIKDEVFGPFSNQKYRECAEILHLSAIRLYDMCNSILDEQTQSNVLNGLDGGIVFFDASETIDEIVTLFKEIATQRGIKLSTKISKDFPRLKVPEQHLYRVLNNIVSNAVKFTPSGGKVTIEACIDKNDDAVIMAIRNTGAGIPATEIMEIMKPFQSTKSIRGDVGSGLGLPIVNKLMREIGGRLEINSNGTTTIILRFPKDVAR